MQTMPSDEFNDDDIQVSSTTPINIKETIPLIVKPPRKWLCLCRSVSSNRKFPVKCFSYFVAFPINFFVYLIWKENEILCLSCQLFAFSIWAQWIFYPIYVVNAFHYDVVITQILYRMRVRRNKWKWISFALITFSRTYVYL